MSVPAQVAMYSLLLFAGFALRYPWRAGPPALVPTAAAVVVAALPAVAPEWTVTTATVAAAEPDGVVADEAAPAAGEYADSTLRQFAAEPVLIDLIEDQAMDPDAEVREEAGAALVHLADLADRDLPHP